jgi:hypothetical protein
LELDDSTGTTTTTVGNTTTATTAGYNKCAEGVGIGWNLPATNSWEVGSWEGYDSVTTCYISGALYVLEND